MNFESIKHIVTILMGINVIYIIMGWLDITNIAQLVERFNLLYLLCIRASEHPTNSAIATLVSF